MSWIKFPVRRSTLDNVPLCNYLVWHGVQTKCPYRRLCNEWVVFLRVTATNDIE